MSTTRELCPSMPAPRRRNRPASKSWLLRLRHAGAAARNLATGLPSWTAYLRSKPTTIVVLGMHRSGTSCIARMFNLCGASVGPEVLAADDANKAGYWEPLEGVVVNEALLRLSGGGWDNPPERLISDFRFGWKMRGFLGRLHRRGPAVFKDPRTVITYALWEPLIQRPVVVVVFRNPQSVAQSHARRDGFTLARGLDLWTYYNTQIVRRFGDSETTFWIDFDGGVEHVVERVASVARVAGLQVSEQLMNSYSAELRTSDAANDGSCGSHPAITLYHRLRAKCYARAGGASASVFPESGSGLR